MRAPRHHLSTGIPGPHAFRAAIRVVQLLAPKGVPEEDLDQSFLSVPSGGIYRQTDLRAGLELLLVCGMAICEGGKVYPSPGLLPLLRLADEDACRTMLGIFLATCPPVWLDLARRSSDLLTEVIPTADARRIGVLIPDPASREAFLLSLARRQKPDSLLKLRDLGEEHVVSQCKSALAASGRTDLAERVQRVSLISDQLGYDVISPTLAEATKRLEVKTQGKISSSSRVLLSRNEAEYGLRDPSWALVVCQADAAGRTRLIGWCDADYLRGRLPSDQGTRSRWVSVELVIPNSDLHVGLPLEK